MAYTNLISRTDAAALIPLEVSNEILKAAPQAKEPMSKCCYLICDPLIYVWQLKSARAKVEIECGFWQMRRCTNRLPGVQS